MLQLITKEANCEPDEICDFELQLCDTQPSVITVAKMASHAIFQYNVLAIDDTHTTLGLIYVLDDHYQAYRSKG